MQTKYKRVLIKLSGEALAGEKGTGLDDATLASIAKVIKECTDMGVEVAAVVGGGNFWRGRTGESMDRTRADHMGMLATVINALALCDAFENAGIEARVMTGLSMPEVAQPYARGKAVRHLEKGRVVIFGGGTGNPFFSTDTAAALRAAEIDAEAILLAKKVDGVYDSDPAKNPDAVRFDKITYIDVLNRGLGVMDTTATSLCMDNKMPIRVFGLDTPENIKKVLCGEEIGTLVYAE